MQMKPKLLLHKIPYPALESYSAAVEMTLDIIRRNDRIGDEWQGFRKKLLYCSPVNDLLGNLFMELGLRKLLSQNGVNDFLKDLCSKHLTSPVISLHDLQFFF